MRCQFSGMYMYDQRLIVILFSCCYRMSKLFVGIISAYYSVVKHEVNIDNVGRALVIATLTHESAIK